MRTHRSKPRNNGLLELSSVWQRVSHSQSSCAYGGSSHKLFPTGARRCIQLLARGRVEHRAGHCHNSSSLAVEPDAWRCRPKGCRLYRAASRRPVDQTVNGGLVLPASKSWPIRSRPHHHSWICQNCCAARPLHEEAQERRAMRVTCGSVMLQRRHILSTRPTFSGRSMRHPLRDIPRHADGRQGRL